MEPVSDVDAGPREPRVSTEWLHDVENHRGLVIEQRTARMLVLDLRDERERTAQLQGDLYRIVRALDIGARTYSGHEAMDKDILPAIAQLQSEVTRLRGSLREIALYGGSAPLGMTHEAFTEYANRDMRRIAGRALGEEGDGQ